MAKAILDSRMQRNWNGINWQFCCDQMTRRPEILKGAILQPDGHILATTPDFIIAVDNFGIKNLFVHPRNIKATFSVGGEQYSLRKAGATSVQGVRIGTGGGCILVKNDYVIVIGIYVNPPTTQLAAEVCVDILANYLKTEIERTSDDPGDSPGTSCNMN